MKSSVTLPLDKPSGRQSVFEDSADCNWMPEFVRGFVQHTLPRGFQKIRHYGWMSPNSQKFRLDEVKWLVWLFLGWTYWLASGHAPQREPMTKPQVRCAQCGGVMRVVDITFEPTGVLSEHALRIWTAGERHDK